MTKTGVTGIRRVWNALFYSLAGMRLAWQHEAAFRQELTLVILLLPVAFWLGPTAVERSLLIGCLFVVLITELLNSANEAIVDRVGTERHPLSGQSKEMASAAGFLSLLLTAIVWGMISWQRFVG